MRILVSGGTGLLGGRLIPKLADDGHQIFALSRSVSSRVRLSAMGATPISADLEADAPLTLPEIDAVVHAAALFRFSGPRKPIFRTNVDGTLALLKAVGNAGAKTFVHISAAGVIQDVVGTPIRNADESAPTFPNHFSAYLASKAQAESLVLAANKPGFRTIALRPPAIWGLAILSAARSPMRSGPVGSLSLIAATIPFQPATSTMWWKLSNARLSAAMGGTPSLSQTRSG